MIKVIVKDAGALSPREATALGMMFMHLAGHEMEEADTREKPFCNTEEVRLAEAKKLTELLLRDKSLQDMLHGKAAEMREEDSLVSQLDEQPDVFARTAKLDVEEDELIHKVCLQADMSSSVPAPPSPFVAPPPPPQTFEVDTSNTVDFSKDSTGVQWDERIHAKNRSKTPSGVWKLGRNLSPDLIKSVLKELRWNAQPITITSVEGTTCQDIPLAPPAPVSLPVAPPPPALVVPVLPPVAPPVMPPLAPQIMPPIAPPVPMPLEDPYDTLVIRIQSLMDEGKLGIAQMNMIVRSHKDAAGNPLVPTLGLVCNKPELIPLIMAQLDNLG